MVNSYRKRSPRAAGGRAIPLAALLLIAAAVAARADERILSYHSDIEVHTNASLTVTERVQVRTEGARIKRGIYRDFPTRYRHRLGHRVHVGLKILGVRRDGNPEPYHVEPISNGKRIKIGEKKVFIPSGIHTYEIVYRTTRQIGFFAEHDELYWNVTGNDWAFPIDEASAAVRLPASIDPQSITVEGYTGPQGSTDSFLKSEVDANGVARFATTRLLGPQQGLTIVAGWPKGHVRPPTRKENLTFLFCDNPTFLAALGGLLLMLAYYAAAWVAVGRDPEKGTIIPRFVPPQKISPAAARYVMQMGYDHRCFAAALINLAVRRHITLEHEKSEFTIHKLDAEGGVLSPGEQKVLRKLLGSRPSLALKQAYHATIHAAVKALEKALEGEYTKQYFITNSSFLIPGGILALLTLVAVVAVARAPELAFLSLWLSLWTLGVAGLLVQVARQWRDVLTRGGIAPLAGAVFITLFAVPFVGAEIFVGYQFARGTSVPTVLALLAMVPMTSWFHHLLKSPTRRGRKLMDALEGFRQYLGVAEEDRLAALHPPEKTPELFEAYLPYALALGVEQQWSERFADVLAEAGRDPGQAGYHPGWVSSRSGFASPAALAGVVGASLASTVAASSAAPGSRSGGGGGGSSGGGGGGGGGGGW